MSRTIIGIDLGTTFSLAAVVQDGKPIVLPNALGETLTPSAVAIAADGMTLVGAAARAMATTHPERTALSFKRDMGTDRVRKLAGKSMTAPELSALVLGTLKRDAEATLGKAVDEAVVTVPAYFGDLQRQATRDAASIAGLHVERIINEPTAAALAYGLHQRHREMRCVVLDLGGGTFDVTVLEIIEGVIEIQASAGDARLGGDDFDEALAALLCEQIRAQHHADPRSDPTGWARIREAAETAKKRLSDSEETHVALVDLPLPGRRATAFEAHISRAQAETAWASLLDRMRGPIHRALRDARVLPERIDEVLLVGGSTRMPCVARMAAQTFGKLPQRSLPPDEAVALGAAVQAALKAGDAAVEDLVATDVAPFTLGIATSQDHGQQRVEGIFSPIIERGTVIPASRMHRYFTVADNQTLIRIKVFQGEHSLCADNQPLGGYEVGGLKPAPRGEEGVDVRFTYDLNGILEVETTIVSTGKTATLVIERTPGRMSKDEIARARAAFSRLKFHPREALPNVTTLARADALHVELSGAAREHLAAAIARFRAILETQRPEEIETAREQLAVVLDALRRGFDGGEGKR
jgi:molecular chaperone HscC